MTENVTTEVDIDTSAWWIPIWEFLVHTVVGTSLFLLIAFPAIGLNLLIHKFQVDLSLSPLIILSLTVVEYLILASDLFLFSIFIIRSVSRTIKLM